MNANYTLYAFWHSALARINENFDLGATMPVNLCLEILATGQIEQPRQLIERRIGTNLDELDEEYCIGQVMIEAQLILREKIAEHRQQVRREEQEAPGIENERRKQEEIEYLKARIVGLDGDSDDD